MSVTRRPPRRRAFQVLELLFVLPILTLLLVASLGYASVQMTHAGLTQAATVGAREAGRGGDIADVVAAVNEVLATYQIAIDDRPGSGAKVTVHDGSGRIAAYGDPNLPGGPSPWVGPNEVCVTVSIDSAVRKTNGTRTSLSTFGFLGLPRQPLCLRSSVNKGPSGAAATGGGSPIVVAYRD